MEEIVEEMEAARAKMKEIVAAMEETRAQDGGNC